MGTVETAKLSSEEPSLIVTTAPDDSSLTPTVSLVSSSHKESVVESLCSDGIDVARVCNDSSFQERDVCHETAIDNTTDILEQHEKFSDDIPVLDESTTTCVSESSSLARVFHASPLPVAGQQSRRRNFGTNPLQLTYSMGSFLWKGEEVDVELEYHSLHEVPLRILPVHMMKCALPFIAACLNSRLKGTIGFGVVGRKNKENATFSEVVGVQVEKNVIRLIKAEFAKLLDHHIETKTFSKLDRLQRECIKMFPIKVTNISPRGDRTAQADRCVFEIDVDPQWTAFSTHLFYCRWASQDHDLLEPTKEIHVSRSKALVAKDRTNRVLVERRDGQTWQRRASQESVLAREVEQKYQRYKQMVEETKRSASSGLVFAIFLLLYVCYSLFIVESSCDEAQLVRLLKERLKAFTTSIFDYVLIANSIPSDQRTTRAPFPFEFVKLLPLVGVIDFDQDSEKDGLYKCVTTRLDDGNLPLQPLILHCDDCEKHFTRSFNKMFCKTQVLHAAHQLPWIFANGRKGEFERVNDATWFCECKSDVDTALKTLKQQFPHVVAMFLVFGESAIKEMAWLLDSVFSLFKPLQSSKSEKKLLILCDEQRTVDSLVKSCSMHEVVRNHCVAGLPWKVVGGIINDLAETIPLEDGAKHLRTSSGVVTSVSLKKLNEWRSIEVIDYYESKKTVPEDCITEIRDSFYKGEPVLWDNLKLNHDVRRDIALKVKQCVQDRLHARSGQELAESFMKVLISITVVTILHRPGTGGSTLAKRIMWDLHQEAQCRCAVIEGITEKTAQYLEELQRFGEKNNYGGECLPLLLCWDGDDANQFSNLVIQLSRRGVRGVVLEVRAMSHPDMDEDEILGDATFVVPSELKEAEVTGLKAIVLQLEQSQEKRTQILQDVDRDRCLFYFGLRLFGKQYNQERLMHYVNQRLKEMSYIEQQLLQFCSFVYIYGHMSIPRSCFKDTYLSKSAEDMENFNVKCVSLSCSDLLLEVHETNHKYGYFGWRPAHQLVAEIVLNEKDLVQTGIDFLSTMLQGQSYGTKYLAEVACELFSKRTYYHKGDEWYDEYDEIATDFYRGKERQTKSSRYSLFITETLDTYNVDTAIVLWFTLCTFVRENPYAWQHFARFLALDVKDMHVNPFLRRHICKLLSERITANEFYSLQLIPTDDIRLEDFRGNDEPREDDRSDMDGFELALKCIHEAHTLEPDVSAIHSTEGLIYKIKLDCFASNLDSNLKERKVQMSTADVEQALTITNLAFQAFRKAQSCRQEYRNWYPLVGEIQVGIKMLQILKGWSAFEKRYYTRDGLSFEAYVNDEFTEFPESLSPQHEKLLKSLVKHILHLLHSVFQHESAVHADRSTEEPIQRHWKSAVMAASELQMQFYKTLSFKTEQIYADRKRWKDNPKMKEMLSDAILKDYHENPYSSWNNLPPRTMMKLIDVLMAVVKERGSRVGCSTVIVLIRACLETDKPPTTWSEIAELICNSCIDFPHSEWVFMFRGMIHFPFPDDQGRFMAHSKLAIESFHQCKALMRNKSFQYKRARPRYFVGRNSDGYVFLPFGRVSHLEGSLERHKTEGLFLNSQEWWRSHPAWTRLARLEGTRLEGRIINYKGIRLRMDKDPNPYSEGREKLWFCVGFTVQGPVAFDPMDEDTYTNLCEAEENGEIPTFEKILEERMAERRAGTDSARANVSTDRQRSQSRRGTRTAGVPRRDSSYATDNSAPRTSRDKKTNVEHKTDTSDHTQKVGLRTTQTATNGGTTICDIRANRNSTTRDSETALHADECESSLETASASVSSSARNMTGNVSPTAAASVVRLSPTSGGDATFSREVDDHAPPSGRKKFDNSKQQQSSHKLKRALIVAGISGFSDVYVRKVAAQFGAFKLQRYKNESCVLVFQSPKDAESAHGGLSTAFEGRHVEVKWERR